MKKKDFIQLLKDNGYKYYKKNSEIIITHQGNVDLRSCTTLPDGIKFENQGSVYLESCTTLPDGIKFENQGNVYLESCTTLPDGIKFENQGNVDLRSCTTLPDGIKFENQGNVDLESCTTLPDGIKFENQGNVYLESCTTLPDGIKFENQGSVDLRSCTTLNYLGKKLKLKYIDGFTMIIDSSKQKDDFTIYKAKYFKGVALNDMPKCIIAERDGYFSHGETIKQAIESVNFKYLQNNLNLDELVSEIKNKNTVSKNEYRLLTGACEFGVNQFCKDNNISDDELPLDKVLKIIKGHYGSEKMYDLFKY